MGGGFLDCTLYIVYIVFLQAKIFKEKGTKHFKHEKYEIASTRYQKVIDFLEHEISLKG